MVRTEYFPPSRPSHSPSQRRNTHLSVKSDIMTEFANEILVLEIPVFRDKSLVSLFQLENGIRWSVSRYIQVSEIHFRWIAMVFTLLEKWLPIPKKLPDIKQKQMSNNINVRMDFRMFIQKIIFPNH